jgi:hypothetical protein
MGLAQKTKTIGDLEVTVVQFGVIRSIKLKNKLADLLAPALTAAAPLFEGGFGALMAADTAQLAPALKLLFTRLGVEFEPLMLEILAGTSVTTRDDNGQLVKIDLMSVRWIEQVFNGNMLALYDVMWFALEANYRDFFEGIATRLRARKQAATATSP